MITINGLTKRQVALLDKMWSIKGIEEYMEWKSELCYAQKQQCELLETMVMLAELDEVEDVSDAVSVLDRIRG